MKKEEIYKLFEDNPVGTGKVLHLTDYFDIVKKVEIRLEINEETYTYYYEMNIDDVVSSALTDKELSIMKDYGWYLSNDREKLLFNLG
jgi:hypothetical protein